MEIVPTIPLAPQVLTPAAGAPDLTDGTEGFARLFEKAAAGLTTAEQEPTAGSGDSAFSMLLSNTGCRDAAESEPTSEDTAEPDVDNAGSAVFGAGSLLPAMGPEAQPAEAGESASASLHQSGVLCGERPCPADPAGSLSEEQAGNAVDDVAGGFLRTQPTSPAPADMGEMHSLHGAVETAEGSAVQKDRPQPDEPTRPSVQPMHPEPREKHALRPAQSALPQPSAGEDHADVHEGMMNAHKEAAAGRLESTGEPSANERRSPEAPADRQFSHLNLPQTGVRPESAPEQAALQAVIHHDRQLAPAATAAVETQLLRQTVEPKFHLIRRDEQTFEVHVEPEGLGMLDIRIVLDRGTVSAHIIAAEDRVRDFMSQHLGSLASALAAEGVKVGDLSVGGRGRETGTMQDENGRGATDRKQDDAVPQNRAMDAGSGISIFV